MKPKGMTDREILEKLTRRINVCFHCDEREYKGKYVQEGVDQALTQLRTNAREKIKKVLEYSINLKVKEMTLTHKNFDLLAQEDLANAILKEIDKEMAE